MNNFIISLKTASERRNHIKSIFNLNNIGYTFFDAIGHQDIKKCSDELGINLGNSTLKENEISCLLSHLSLWKKIIDENFEYITIYEDDIHLGQNSNIFLSNYKWIPKGCDIIKLEYFYSDIYINNKDIKELEDNRKLVALVDKHLGCGGYIISRKAAIELLDFVRNHDEILPVDHYIFNLFLLKSEITTYQMYPAICIQDHKIKVNNKHFSSYLSEDRQIRKGEGKYKIKLSFGKKIKKEINRIGQQINLIFSKKIKSKKVKMYFK